MKTKAKQLSPVDSTNGHGTVPSEVPYRSQAERRAECTRLRDAVPRADHGRVKVIIES